MAAGARSAEPDLTNVNLRQPLHFGGGREQVLQGAAGDEAAVVHQQDLICPPQRDWAVRDDQAGHVAAAGDPLDLAAGQLHAALWGGKTSDVLRPAGRPCQVFPRAQGRRGGPQAPICSVSVAAGCQ